MIAKLEHAREPTRSRVWVVAEIHVRKAQLGLWDDESAAEIHGRYGVAVPDAPREALIGLGLMASGLPLYLYWKKRSNSSKRDRDKG